MSAEGKTLSPMPLVHDDVPYLDLMKQDGEAEVSWDIESEGELAVDVIETPQDIIVRSPIAGVRPEDISIHATSDTLTIRGTREACASYPFADTHIEECHWGSFSRTIILPHNIQVAGILATMRHGVLTVTLPKTQTTPDIQVLSTE